MSAECGQRLASEICSSVSRKGWTGRVGSRQKSACRGPVVCQALDTALDVQPQAFTAKKAPVLPFRVGHGFDLHRLEPGYPLIIGGVNIPHDRGCEAHSDGKRGCAAGVRFWSSLKFQGFILWLGSQMCLQEMFCCTALWMPFLERWGCPTLDSCFQTQIPSGREQPPRCSSRKL